MTHAFVMQNNSKLPLNRRHWLAKLDMSFEQRRSRTVMVDCAHLGPLRVQRPFFPEQDGTTHIYLLHPPGGIAIGDELYINAKLGHETNVVFTTPSAGKFYGKKGLDDGDLTTQKQSVCLRVQKNACCEWLPQETIIYDSAQAETLTRVELESGAHFFGWDILRFGRAASGEHFTCGSCTQSFELYENDRLLFVERFPLVAGSTKQHARWGLNSNNTLATCVATARLSQAQQDALLDALHTLTNELQSWGLTQKKSLFIARYQGSSMHNCRRGLHIIWSHLRKQMKQKESVFPRIWST